MLRGFIYFKSGGPQKRLLFFSFGLALENVARNIKYHDSRDAALHFLCTIWPAVDLCIYMDETIDDVFLAV